MKKILCFIFCALCLFCCSCSKKASAIELMGAGDRIHDTYTFANLGVKISSEDDNNYLISGSVEKLTDENVKEEFDIDEDVDHVVVVKLSAVDKKVVKDEVEINVNGARNYDAEHLNGDDYTFIILESVPGNLTTIGVKWNANDQVHNYAINFSNNLSLK